MIAILPIVACRTMQMVDHTFLYHASQALSSVNVAGSFNGWNKEANPMKVQTDGLTWKLALKLAPGKYSYKFVLDGNTWITDPKAQRNEDDGNGNTNSQLIIASKDSVKPAKRGDGFISASALQHSAEIPFFNYDRGQLTVTLRTRPNDIAKVNLLVNGRETPMTDMGGDEFYERYLAKLAWNRKADLHYRFVLNDGKGDMAFGANGLTTPTAHNEFVVSAKTFHPFVVPAWVERSVIYHIFPDRFANGDKSNDPANVVPWNGKPSYNNYFGGDVAGVEQHLGYLKDLGVSAVFFNPVFKSPSNHRYETTDYFQIDPIFGTNQEFLKLTRDLEKNGMKTILDGVFNHTATNFAPFADVVNNGADSKYKNWYTFKSFPVKVGPNPNYEAWFNFPSMPKVNYSSPEARRYMLSVPEFWQTKASVAGWRLDAANEVTPDYWVDFRKKVKSINPNAWIVGEVWGDGTPWLKGDQWDSVMNYQFREAVLGFVSQAGSGRPSDLMRKLMGVYNTYVPQVSRNMMNLISSHDTPRILNLCGKDASLAKLAAILQFTWIGTPSIYYGDEIGMEGAKDPDNRRGMTWDAVNRSNSFLNLYKKLVHMRNADRTLQSGDPVPLVIDDQKQVVSFARVLDDKADLIAINRSNTEQSIDLNLRHVTGLPGKAATTEFSDALSGQIIAPTESILHLRLSPRSAAVLIPHSGSISHSRHIRPTSVGAAVAMSKALVNKELP